MSAFTEKYSNKTDRASVLEDSEKRFKYWIVEEKRCFGILDGTHNEGEMHLVKLMHAILLQK